MWVDFMKIQFKEQILRALESTYLLKVDKFELVSEGHGTKIYMHRNDKMFHILLLGNIINGRSVLDSE